MGRSPRSTRLLLGAAALTAAALSPACRTAAPEAAAPLAVAVTTPAGAPHAVVDLTGLTRDEHAALTAHPPTTAGWEQVLRVAIAPADAGADSPPAVAGRYAVTDRGVRFTPAFPLDPGRRYDVRVDLTRVRGAGQRVLTSTVGLPAAPAAAAATRVVGISPSGDLVPENLLRLYVWFSAPMARGHGVPHVTLLDERGVEVKDAFLPVDGGFWNHDFTRYTLFFDPGRVKDGILRGGRPLVAGRRYRLRIAAAWRDARGAPLVEPFEHAFRAGPAATGALDLATWEIAAPPAGTRAPLRIRVPAPLDRALALRAIGVESADGTPIDGEVAIDATDTRWTLTPQAPWPAGGYQVVALDALEDPAGNRVGRAFEVPIDDRPKPPAPSRFTRAFAIAPPS